MAFFGNGFPGFGGFGGFGGEEQSKFYFQYPTNNAKFAFAQILFYLSNSDH